MAIEVCLDDAVSTPRISFSDVLCPADTTPTEKPPLCSTSSNNNLSLLFDFCFHNVADQDSLSADEIFHDGKILPVGIKKRIPASKPVQYPTMATSVPPLRAYVDHATRLNKKHEGHDSNSNNSMGIEVAGNEADQGASNVNQQGSDEDMHFHNSGGIKNNSIGHLNRAPQPNITPPPLSPLRAFLDAAGFGQGKGRHDSKEPDTGKKKSESFRRSSSLDNCAGKCGRTLCPFPLLSQWHSTESAPQDENQMTLAEHFRYENKLNSQRLKPSQLSSATGNKTPSLKKNFGSFSFNHGDPAPQVLSVPPLNLRGLASACFKNKHTTDN